MGTTAPISQEDVHTLPEYVQTVLPNLDDENFPTLILISHSHSPPLRPAPDLKVDVRNIPNPPKHIRDAYNGTSKRLQEWMKEDPIFIARRDAILTEVETMMLSKIGIWEKNGSTSPARNDRPSDEEGVRNDDNRSSENEEQETNEVRKSLTVGIFCEMGKHRSVAMVEELAKVSWPDWHTKIEHRDVFKKRGSKKKAGHERKGKGVRGVADSDED